MVKKDFNYFFLKGNKYFFRSCKEMETIFYHYAENHVEEYIDLFCSTYVKTLSLVECPLYSKQLITWKK